MRNQGQRVSIALIALLALSADSAAATAPGSAVGGQVDLFHGSYQDRFAIETPSYYGLEPPLALTYDSGRGNGPLGLGWSLTGLSEITADPRFPESPAAYFLDSNELLPCLVEQGSIQTVRGLIRPLGGPPSCQAGGTHATRLETYERIVATPGPDPRVPLTWTVTRQDGVSRSYQRAAGDRLRWRLTQVRDPFGHAVTYRWTDDSIHITYGDQAVHIGLYYEEAGGTEPDQRLLRQIRIEVGGSALRTIDLEYTDEALAGRALLTAIRQYGRGAAVDLRGCTLLEGVPDPGLCTPRVTGTPVPLVSLAMRYAADRPRIDYPTTSQWLLAPGSHLDWSARDRGDVPPDPPPFTYADFDGDGRTDLLAAGRVHLSEGTGLRAEAWPADETPCALPECAGLRIEDVASLPGADFDGDGRQDLVTLELLSDGSSPTDYDSTAWIVAFRISLSDGTSFRKSGSGVWATHRAALGVLWNGGGTSGVVATPRWQLDPASYLVADLDGDGRADLAQFADDAVLRVWRSTGAGVAPVETWELDGYFPGRHLTTVAVDGDGNGRADLLTYQHDDDEGLAFVRVHRSTGHGFAPPLDLDLSAADFDHDGRVDACGKQLLVRDFDGDGKTDVGLFFCKEGRYPLHLSVLVWRSYGDRFAPPRFWFLPFDAERRTDVRFRDMNGDGASDVIAFTREPCGAWRCITAARLALSHGNGFRDTGAPLRLDTGGHSTQYVLQDFDGDGATDIGLYGGVYDSDAVALAIDRIVVGLQRPGAAASVLTHIESSDGGTVEVQYAPASSWPSAEVPPHRLFDVTPPTSEVTGSPLLAPLPTVRSVTIRNGPHGIPAKSQYSYAGGLRDPTTRQFLGFQYAREERPCVRGTCTTLETWFPRDAYGVARPQWEVLKEGTGPTARVIAATFHGYETNETEALALATAITPYTWHEVEQLRLVSGRSRDLVTRVERGFDELGMLAHEIDHGDVRRTGDERVAFLEYNREPGAYIMDRVRERAVYAGAPTGSLLMAGTLLERRRFCYDQPLDQAAGQPELGCWQRPLVAGRPALLTATLQWLDSEDRDVPIERRRHDHRGNVDLLADAEGRLTYLAYDLGRGVFVATSWNDLGHVTRTDWDQVCGAPTRITDPNGLVTEHWYDPHCRRVLTLRPGGDWECVGFGRADDLRYIEVVRPKAGLPGLDGRPDGDLLDGGSSPTSPRPDPGTVLTVGCPDGIWERSYVDALGRELLHERRGPDDAHAIWQQSRYDAAGRLAARTAPYYHARLRQCAIDDPGARWTRFAYDATGQLVETELPDRQRKRRELDIVDRTVADAAWRVVQVTSVDEAGHRQTDYLDPRGRVVMHEEVDGPRTVATRYAWSDRGHLVGITDPAGNRWAFQLDSLGRMTRSEDPDRGTWTYGYDDTGRERWHVDAKQVTTEYELDEIGRKSAKLVRAAGAERKTVATWTYDDPAVPFSIGKLTSARNDLIAIGYGYDAAGRVQRTSYVNDGRVLAIERHFDPSGRPFELRFPDGDRVGPLRYDDAGRLVALPGIVEGVRYRADGQVEEMTYANQTRTRRRFSARGGLLFTETNLLAGARTRNVLRLSYRRDREDRIVGVRSAHGHGSWQYQYDALHRLIEARNLTAARFSQHLAYDALGRLERVEGAGLGAYRYGCDDDAPCERPHAVLTAGAMSFRYDGNGQLVERRWSQQAPVELEYDQQGLLVRFGAGGGETHFDYDADGRRLRVRTADGAASVFLGDDYEVRLAPAGAAIAPEQHIKLFRVAGELVARRIDRGTEWLHGDHLGSVRAVSTASGEVRERYDYLPLGYRIGGSRSGPGFTGQRHDATGLVYLHARYLDPVIGRFLAPDPLITSRRIAGLDRYGYVLGDPINATDPSGLTHTPCHPPEEASWIERNMGWLGAIPLVGGAIELIAYGVNLAVERDGTAARLLGAAAARFGIGVALSYGGGALLGDLLGQTLTHAVLGAASSALGGYVSQGIRSGNWSPDWKQIGISAGVAAGFSLAMSATALLADRAALEATGMPLAGAPSRSATLLDAVVGRLTGFDTRGDQVTDVLGVIQGTLLFAGALTDHLVDASWAQWVNPPAWFTPDRPDGQYNFTPCGTLVSLD